jgi:SAM-dependent methyltransferase
LTERLCQRVRRIVCVERSARYLARARARRPANAEIVDTAIEDFECDDRFDHVLAINMLHEVPDVAGVVAHLKRFLKPGGRLHVTLPNPRSLHRLAALHAGMIGDLCEISARGRSFQTLRLLYADEVAGLMKESGLAEVARSSILVKPLPNAAMETLSESVIEAFDALTAELPDFGSMNYFIFRRTGDE